MGLHAAAVRNVLAITRRELGAYFDSPLAYFAVPVYVLLVGGFALWFDDVFSAGVASMRGVMFWNALFLVLFVPSITMRLFSDEYRTGSIEILSTLPLREQELVLGKFFAALALVGVGVAATFGYPITLAVLSVPENAPPGPFLLQIVNSAGLDPGEVICGYLGLLLLGAAITGIGTATSALTNSQIVAFLGSLLLSLFPFLLGMFLDKVPAPLVGLAQTLSLNYHFSNLARGVVDLRDVLFCLSVAALGLHVAIYALQRRRLA